MALASLINACEFGRAWDIVNIYSFLKCKALIFILIEAICMFFTISYEFGGKNNAFKKRRFAIVFRILLMAAALLEYSTIAMYGLIIIVTIFAFSTQMQDKSSVIIIEKSEVFEGRVTDDFKTKIVDQMENVIAENRDGVKKKII